MVLPRHLTENQILNFQHQCESNPPVWLGNLETNEANDPEITVLRQQLPSTNFENQLDRQNKE